VVHVSEEKGPLICRADSFLNAASSL